MSGNIVGGEGVESQEMPPLIRIPEPPNISTTAYQESYYDPTSEADLQVFKKRPQGGPVDPNTGRKTGDFPDSGRWRQT